MNSQIVELEIKPHNHFNKLSLAYGVSPERYDELLYIYRQNNNFDTLSEDLFAFVEALGPLTLGDVLAIGIIFGIEVAEKAHK